MPRTVSKRVVSKPGVLDEAAVVGKAVLRAADQLGLSHKTLARVVGLSEATVSRLGAGAYRLAPGDKPFELSLMLIRLFRSLDAIVGGDAVATRAWLRNENAALGGVPLTLIQSVPGLVNVIAYLDARRAVV